MNFEKKKKELVDEFNQNQQVIQNLAQKNQQILGQVQFIEELEKEELEKDEKDKKEKSEK